MRSLLLMYNIDEKKLSKLRVLCMRLGIKMRQVEKDRYALPIGQLTADTVPEPVESTVEAFDDEMLVMCGFNNAMVDALLKGLRESRIPVIPLKAVLTEENSKWDSFKLHTELTAEHEALKTGRTAHQK
ncbi:MAG: DUF3783 domain-containing protein [Oscillospiraceae bacterium]|nr:DUF3783 domain-containing protein [Oscillospiraceae bacterium]